MSKLVKKFKITREHISGQYGAQVHVIDNEDLEYWRKQADDNGYLIIHGYFVGSDYYMNHYGIPYDVYQIVPRSFLQENSNEKI